MTNDQCRGYMIKALVALDYDTDKINEIMDIMYVVFDNYTEAEAENIYFEYLRGEL